MKTLLIISVGISILCSSVISLHCIGTLKTEIPSGYTSEIDSLTFKTDSMMAVSDSVYRFWFSDDIELMESDTNAYWLMNRMMQTAQYVKTAEDALAWAHALNGNVTEYERKFGRKIYEQDAEDAAMMAIENQIHLYGSGNQPELNAKSYVTSILEHYRAINSYLRLMRIYRNNELGLLLYSEHKEWFDLNNAINGIMVFYTYAAARYSALPIDINYTFAEWSEMRTKELKIEKELFWSYHWKPYLSDSKRVSERRQKRLIGYFSRR